MKILIQMGESRWKFDDGMGSETPFDLAVEAFSDQLRSIYREMEGMQLVAVDDELAKDMFGEDSEVSFDEDKSKDRDDDKDNGSDFNEEKTINN